MFGPRNKEYEGEEYTLNPISNVVSTNLNIGSAFPNNTTKLLIMYIIGYDHATYESWSKTLGYTDQYVVVTQQALTPQ